MTAPPSAALRLLREGHTVARVIEWTGVSRWPLTLALHAEGMYVDRHTDTARAIPVEQNVAAWRIWARANGWPNLNDLGKLPPGLMDAYLQAHPEDQLAARVYRRSLRRDRRKVA